MNFSYTLLRSKRKTMAIEITRTGDVLVRVPLFVSDLQALSFLKEKEGWVESHRQKVVARREAYPEPTKEEARRLKAMAEEQLPALVERYAAAMGLTPAHISITGARTRFGSCSGKNRICFSWRLMVYPQAAIEYVVVHELAHLKEKNHGSGFYKLVSQYMPDYKEREKLLKNPPTGEE